MKTVIAVALAAIVLAPATVNAAPKHKMAKMGHTKMTKMAHPKMAAATKYECVKCHMQYSAAEAKKAHYKCDMDGGKLVPVKTASSKKPMGHM